MKIPVTDFSRDTKAADEIKAFSENFKKYDNYIKVLVEVNNSQLGENDFLFRIVGKYKHN